jgi:tetratricopeptide (TPR) repeat protein
MLDSICLNPNSLKKIWGLIGVEKSTASRIEDQNKIFHFVRSLEKDFSTVNAKIFELIRSWIVETTHKSLQQVEKDDFVQLSQFKFALGILYKYQEKYEHAERMLLQCLELQEKIYGKNHGNISAIIDHIAFVFARLSKDEEAEQMYLDSLEHQEKDKLDTESTLFNFANLLTKRGKFERARSIYEQILYDEEIKLGVNHPEYLKTLNMFAKFHKKQSNFIEAEKLFLRCYESKKEILGLKDLSTINTMRCLANVYSDMNIFDKAEFFYRRA